MKSTWNKTTTKVVEAVKAVAGPIVRAVTTTVAHKCDPTGWRCDCARREAINNRNGKPKWIERRKDWLG